jgi:tetratricopeptide (TPR) repeat protein
VETALILDHRNEVTGAVAKYREAIAVDPGIPEAHYKLGRLLRDNGNLAAALSELQKANAIEPNNTIYIKAAKDLQQQMSR